jgi:hypothetical protein
MRMLLNLCASSMFAFIKKKVSMKKVLSPVKVKNEIKYFEAAFILKNPIATTTAEITW